MHDTTADGRSLQRLHEDELAGTTVLHWYDLTCPFCYVGRSRTRILTRVGVDVVELPFRAHPEIPESGIDVPERHGPMYDLLAREASAADLPLAWQPKLPNSGLALAAAEWTRTHVPDAFGTFVARLFAAHFAEHRDIGDPRVVEEIAATTGFPVGRLSAAFADGSAHAALVASERLAREVGVTGTPAWAFSGELVVGLRPVEVFERLAHASRGIA